MRRLLALLLLASCSDDNAEPSTVPADVRPEDATFRYVTRNQSQTVLVVRMSRADFCNRESVPDKQRYVEIDVAVPLGSTVVPGSYSAGMDAPARISLLDAGARCASSVGAGVSSGTVTLDEVGISVVRGRFRGVNPDSRLDLQGSFVARRCLDDAAACL